MPKPLLSERFPFLYHVSVWEKRLLTMLRRRWDGHRYARERAVEPLARRIRKHQSPLLRKLGASEMRLQHNKVRNLELAVARLDGILIRPGETFSFCGLVGRTTRRKGYLEGMELAHGEARPGVGGGICQISNLIHWLVLHSPLTVIERHHHGFDPFPDDGRVLPFGSGATVFYNYVDYRFRNDTRRLFQIRLRVGEKHLEGELRADDWLAETRHVYEKEHEFVKIGAFFYRKNEIWCEVREASGGKRLRDECVAKNCARVMYTPEHYREASAAEAAVLLGPDG
jgi:vancomycin resistance protein VanW